MQKLNLFPQYFHSNSNKKSLKKNLVRKGDYESDRKDQKINSSFPSWTQCRGEIPQMTARAWLQKCITLI